MTEKRDDWYTLRLRMIENLIYAIRMRHMDDREEG